MRATLVMALALAGAILFSVGTHADESGGGWVPDFTAQNSDPEMKKYITHAESELGGNCCAWADGFMLGKPYKFDRSSPKGSVWKVVLYSWEAKPDGYYAVVWDYLLTGNYVTLRADYKAFAPGNPTGTPIVWLRRKGGTAEIEIRCYGGEPQT